MIKRIFFCSLLMTIHLAGAAEKDTSKTWMETARLFTTPAERTRLDGLRQTASVLALQAQEAKKELEEDIAMPLPVEVHMQGYVKRSDGRRNTVWVNHKAIQENSSTADVQVGNLSTKFKSKNKLDGADEVRMKLSGNGQEFNLKAGQRYLPDENKVKDLALTRIGEEHKPEQINLYRKNSEAQGAR
jgi:hypothetical protein